MVYRVYPYDHEWIIWDHVIFLNCWLQFWDLYLYLRWRQDCCIAVVKGAI